MPAPREWPTVAADDRDQAAEAVQEASIRLERITSKMPPEVQVEVCLARIDLQKSLRLLERHGAKTRVARDPLQATM